MNYLTASQRYCRRVFIFPLFFSLSYFSAFSTAMVLPGELQISEIMANPSAVSDSNGEWFEVFNRSNQSIDIEGLVIQDQGSNLHTVNSGDSLWIASGEYFVFGRNGDSASNGGYEADYVYSNFTLGNSSDAIILLFLDQIIDSLAYDDGSFGTAGNSNELTSGFTLTPDTFIYGDGDIGTPGSAGSTTLVSAVPIPAAGWLMASALSGLLIARKRKSS